MLDFANALPMFPEPMIAIFILVSLVAASPKDENSVARPVIRGAYVPLPPLQSGRMLLAICTPAREAPAVAGL
ncbi:MAG: hypothetical protein AUH69_08340 [Actinobacteria bacterium 13_1_40CM_4_65_12]|nr:MAG: hypothetical protein AUH40_02945 [Chloroflexi bacterium 13_1_40CM_65_17]OLC65950.1 MAG: hypothetical protein AUH69_08340 [Actinobacteria bacterium 13_1_40CM_4_65_12]